MGIPTAGEADIYKNEVRTYEVKVQVEIDESVFAGSWQDQFNDASVDSNRWRQYLPEGWGTITESGGTLTVTTGGGTVPYPPYAVSKTDAGRVFPTDEDEDFDLEVRLRFPTIEAYGVQFRALGLEHEIFEVEANTADGLNVKLDGVEVASFGADTAWYTWRLEYAAATQTYTALRDGTVQGTAIIDELPVQLVIGNSAVNQGEAGLWSDIVVDYVTVTGTAESSSTPAWATPFSEDGITWSYLPTQTEGRIDVHKNNNVDRCEVRALNQDSTTQGIYAGTNFYGKRLRVKSRVGDDAGNWTDWAVRFRGVVVTPRLDVVGGESTLILDCQDEARKALAETFVVRAYADYATPITGIVNNYSVAGIIENLLQQADLAAADYSISGGANGTLVPKTFNVIDVAVADAVAELVESVVWTWYVNPDDGVVWVGPLDWAEGASPDYVLRTSEEVERVRYAQDALNAVAQSVVTAQNTAGTDVALAYPAAPIPPHGRIDRFSSLAAQSLADLEDNEIPKERWQRMNRETGSIEVVMSCQNWLEHDLHVAVEDTAFLGLAATKVWVVDGWRERWNGQDYVTTVQLADPDFAQIIRDNL